MNAQEYQAMFAVEDSHWWYVRLREEITWSLRRFMEDAPRSRRVRVLDAGCGTGGLLTYLAHKDGYENTGLDLEEAGLALAQSRGLRNLLQASVTGLPFRTDAFDAVISIDVLCHTGVDEIQALREFTRVLRPGGIVILQLPAFEWLRSEHDAAVSTKRRYTRAEIEGLLTQAGLTIQRSSYRNVLLFPVIVALRMWRRARVHAADPHSDVKPTPRALNRILTSILRAEFFLSTRLVRFPFGLSVFCVASKD